MPLATNFVSYCTMMVCKGVIYFVTFVLLLILLGNFLTLSSVLDIDSVGSQDDTKMLPEIALLFYSLLYDHI